MHYLYSALLTLAAILGSPYWIYKAVKERKYLKNIRQRLGLVLPEERQFAKPLWIHAVSVGEVLAAKPLFAALRASRPDMSIVVSTVTLTGQALARKELAQAEEIFFFPFDWDFCVRRFLDRLHPCAIVLMETELWPNFLRLCSESEIPVFLANGRISDHSIKRYRRIKTLTGFMLEKLKVLGVQTPKDKRRFIELGAKESQIRITGNLKFDFAAPNIARASELLGSIRACFGLDTGNQAIVIGSSMRGEEALFLDVFRRVRESAPEARLILAPRHPERFEETADLIAKTGMPFHRRSELGSFNDAAGTEILLLDTIGELRAVYSLAAVAVIGGSFLSYGGHNLLEPAALGKAIVFGPEMSNFKEMAALFLREQAARQCALEDLPAALCELLKNPRARNMLGQRAASTFRQNQGATEATVAFLLPHIQ